MLEVKKDNKSLIIKKYNNSDITIEKEIKIDLINENWKDIAELLTGETIITTEPNDILREVLANIFYSTKKTIPYSIIDIECLMLIIYPKKNIDPTESLTQLYLKCKNKINTLPLFIKQLCRKHLQTSHPEISKLFDKGISEKEVNTSLNYKDFLEPLYNIDFEIKDSKKSNELSLEDIFINKKGIKSTLEKYESRGSQYEMAKFIEKRLEKKEHGLIEAPTGTGKSLAYLVPSLLWSVKQKEPVIISTKTKPLQNQLIKEDIPKIQLENGPDFSYIMIKGKENYVDIERFDQLYRNFLLGAQIDTAAFIGLLHWIIKTKSGDLTELNIRIFNQFNNMIKYSKNKTTNKTRNKNYCFIQKLKKKAKQSNIIITNHALFFSDLKTEAGILPYSNTVIFDEAHSLEDIATKAFSYEWNNFFLIELEKVISEEEFGLVNGLKSDFRNDIVTLKSKLSEIEMLHSLIKSHCITLFEKESISKFSQSLIIDNRISETNYWIECEDYFLEYKSQLNSLLELISKLQEKIPNDNKNTLKQDCQQGINIIVNLEEIVNMIVIESFNKVKWIEYNRASQSIRLIVSPINCNKELSDRLLDKRPSIIATSATLALNNSFKYIEERLGFFGIEHPYYTLKLKSEFNYKKQAIFVKFDNLPDYTHSEEYNFKNLTIIEELLKENNKSMLLLTSYEALNWYSEQLLNRKIIHCFIQDKQIPRETLINQFKAFPEKALLIGVDSFWEGVDLPGEQLSSIIIPKLPFANPKEPLIYARTEQYKKEGRNGFNEYYLQLAILKFKQGIGRLIRSKNDSGCIYVLDKRLYTKSYGKKFLDQLKDYNTISKSIINTDYQTIKE